MIDPVCAMPTLSLICDVVDPISGEAFSRDPRNVARKALAYLRSTGIADEVYMGPEAEFFIFDKVHYYAGQNAAGYAVDSEEAPWNSAVPGLGHQIGFKGGYFPVSRYDANQDLRSEMVHALIDAGLNIEVHHHEVGTAGQAEIDIKFGPLVQMADNIQVYKYVIKNVAKKNGKSVTFMPKPIFQENGSGMHTHQTCGRTGSRSLSGDKYAGLSQTALWYIGGILKHINSLLAFAAPTTNSYRRLVPGYERRLWRPTPPAIARQPSVFRPIRTRLRRSASSSAARTRRRTLSGLCRHADGRPGRHQEPDRPGQPG